MDLNNRNYEITSENEKEQNTKEGFIIPKHYLLGHYQVIDCIQDQLSNDGFKGFCKGMIIKYICRADFSKDKLRDYTKANYYLDQIINSYNNDEKLNNRVNPSYYKKHSFEAIDIIEDQMNNEEIDGFYAGIILRYILRAEHKHGLEDYKKAKWYLDRRLNMLKQGKDSTND